MSEMEAYISAAEQVKVDVFAEYRSLSGASEEAAGANPHVDICLDNIEIFFRNAVKNKLFSDRARKVKSQPRDLNEELLPAYLTSSEMDSYDDAIESIKCSKKIAYLLFISQYSKFRIAERSRFGEILRRLEQGCPKTAVLVYNHKKELCESIMEVDAPLYNRITTPLTKYLQAIQQLLDIQRKIYQCERNLMNLFTDFLGRIVSKEAEANKSLTNPSALKALNQTLTALRERGLDIPEMPKNITDEYIKPVRSLLSEHVGNLKGEDAMIAEVIGFLEDIIYYSDERNLPDKDGTASNSESSIIGMIENLPGKFKEWLAK